MQKTPILLLVFLIAFSCKKDNKKQVAGNAEAINFNVEEWPKKAVANAEAAKILAKWPEYVALETSFESIYTSENSEDLSLIIEDLIEKQKAMAESTYPVEFDRPHIKSRQIALKTYILKTKGNLEYRLDLQEPVIEMIAAFNALRNQFNVILNSKIDIDLLQEKKK
ncbi:hypothetical protein [Aurantibacter crassamenti]|uniref:hypothetical protein n=1 Tax=Aurantibacter crassamenti TaxID=1837375 RepID=UPI001EEDBE3E|nr:hypothetical protein [Aurantibacter crassamenti]